MIRSRRNRSRWLLAFVAGFVATLVFHQGIWTLLYEIHLQPHAPFPLGATVPFGVPAIWSLAFWGGVWGLLFMACERFFPPFLPAYLVMAILFGAIAPTFFAWFVVFPLKGIPIAGGFKTPVVITGLSVNAAWGFGTGLFVIGLAGFRK